MLLILKDRTLQMSIYKKWFKQKVKKRLLKLKISHQVASNICTTLARRGKGSASRCRRTAPWSREQRKTSSDIDMAPTHQRGALRAAQNRIL